MEACGDITNIETNKTVKCCVPDCDDTTSKRHRFPINEKDRFKEWVKAMKIPGLDKLSLHCVYRNYYVCSRHFSDDHIVPGVKGFLKQGAVPNLFLKEYICRLCLKKCDHFEAIEEKHDAVLNLFSLRLNLAISKEPVMCKRCAGSLHKCSIFKTASLYVKNHLTSFSGQTTAMDVCLFCKRILMFGSFVFLNNTTMDILLLKAMVEQYFPELGLPSIPNPIICSTCYECLQKNFDLIINCLSVEEKIKKYRKAGGTSNTGQVELKNVLNFVTQDTVVYKNACEGVQLKNDKCIIDETQSNNNSREGYGESVGVEDEIIDQNAIKTEDGDEDENNINEPEEMKLKTTKEDIKIEDTCNEEVDEVTDKNPEKVVDTVGDIIEEVVQKWGYLEENTLNVDFSEEEDSEEDDFAEEENDLTEEVDFKVEKQSGGRVVGVRKEDTRDETMTQGNGAILRRHLMKIGAGNDSPPKNFLTKSALRAKITRVEVSGEKKYQCQICHFVAKAKCSINRHMLLHQDPSETTLYECHVCDYKTKHKWDLRSHIDIHRDPSQVVFYKCEYCSFQTRYKPILKKHEKKHKVMLEKGRYECDLCCFGTVHETHFNIHMQRHKKEKVWIRRTGFIKQKNVP